MAQGTPINVLVCPKCGAPMRAYERNGITIDQCTECRGIFLDRGELEHLLGAEEKYYREDRRKYDDDDDDRRRDDRGYDKSYDKSYEYKKPKKKRSFLENLFDD
jgi:Zn-finger nucleic acid-binding protein